MSPRTIAILIIAPVAVWTVVISQHYFPPQVQLDCKQQSAPEIQNPVMPPTLPPGCKISKTTKTIFCIQVPEGG